MDLNLYELIFIGILALSLIEAGTKIMLPISRRLAELLLETAREKKASREALEAGGAGGDTVALMEGLQDRLDRLEDRLHFLEELRAPDDRPRINAPR